MPEQLRSLPAVSAAAVRTFQTAWTTAPRTAHHTETADLRPDRHRKMRNHTAPDSAICAN